MLTLGAVPALAQPTKDEVLETALGHSARGVESILKAQITDPKDPYCGLMKNGYGIPVPATGAGLFNTLGSALVHPKSKFYRNAEVFDRLKLAADGLKRNQSAAGFLDNLDTNFNSPADTAFAVRSAAEGMLVAVKAKANELVQVMKPFIKSASDGLAVGGIHTPNHRWVLSAALAQANEILPNAAYVKRIDQWLAEGIDIDEDGMYTERSVGTYNPIVDSSLLMVAEKLNRPSLLAPVRANLKALEYLINPNGESVTEFSRRQDLYQRTYPSNYYFSWHWMALKDKNPIWGGLAAQYREQSLSLTLAMLYPDFLLPLATAPLPTDYRHEFKHNRVTRIRRGDRSATVVHNGASRILSVQKGDAVVTAVRFISSFFGKGQFKPTDSKIQDGRVLMTQRLEGPYYQPFTPTRVIDSEAWDTTQKQRPKSEISTFEQSALFEEIDGGFALRIRSSGTKAVPMIVEIAFREGGKIEGAEPIADTPDAYLFGGKQATYRIGKDAIHVSPGIAMHSWTKGIRYIEPKLPGPTLFLTGFAPFDHRIEFKFS